MTTLLTRTCGIELEYSGPPKSKAQRLLRRVFGDDNVRSTNTDTLAHDGNTWWLKDDGSVTGYGTRSDGSRRAGWELASPILSLGQNGARQVSKAVMAVNAENGTHKNASCGFHVHVQCDDLADVGIRNLVLIFTAFRLTLDYFTPPHRRIGKDQAEEYFAELPPAMVQAARNGTLSWDNVHNLQGDRYRALNFVTNLPTVEFRLFMSTRNPVKAASIMGLCVRMVTVAHELPPQTWNELKTFAAGDNSRADRLARFFRFLSIDKDTLVYHGDDGDDQRHLRTELRHIEEKWRHRNKSV